MEEHYAGLVELLDQFRRPQTPYLPRPYPQFVTVHGSYDHLSRHREWSAGSGEGT
jgi:ATP-dependent helicase/nuclease subunit B